MTANIEVPDWALDGESIEDGDELGELINAFNLVNSALNGHEAYVSHRTEVDEFSAFVQEQHDLEDAAALKLAGLIN